MTHNVMAKRKRYNQKPYMVWQINAIAKKKESNQKQYMVWQIM